MHSNDKKALRVGVYIPGDLAEELNKVMSDLGIESLSRAVQEALRLYIAEHKWMLGGSIVGAVAVLYDHEVGNVDEELTDAQHRHLDMITSALHVHLDERKCLLVAVVRGDVDKVKRFVNEVEKIRGVMLVRVMAVARQ